MEYITVVNDICITANDINYPINKTVYIINFYKLQNTSYKYNTNKLTDSFAYLT